MTDEIKKDLEKKNDTPKDNGDVTEVVENKKENKTGTLEKKEKDSEGNSKVENTKEDKSEIKKTFTKRTQYNARDGKGGFKKNFRKRAPFKREKPEFEQKILSLRRVTRVMAGGRRFSFSVSMVVGDKKGRVGFGMGKSSDTTLAIEKAVRNAKKNMVKVKLTKNGSVEYDVFGKYKSSEIVIRPVHGKGLAAGGAVRTILEFAGAKEAGAKILSRSKNHINNAKATLIALEPFSEKVEVSLVVADRKKRNFKPRRFGDKKPFFKKPFDKNRNIKNSETSVKATPEVIDKVVDNNK